MKALPNLLTAARLVLGLAMFLCLAAAAGALPFIAGDISGEDGFALLVWALILFVVASVTDFFDGWLARKWNATSVWGAILDPIADKILVCGTILGLLSQGGLPWVTQIALPAAIILFREFMVSALREAGARRGVEFPVTVLAKWKTTVQLVALGAVLLLAAWPALFGAAAYETSIYPVLERGAVGLMWLGALISLWTGWEYFGAARRSFR